MKRDGMMKISAVLLVAAVGSLMGCQYDQLKTENDDLWTQNHELQEELGRLRLALRAAEMEHRNLVAQQDQIASVNIVPVAAANTGFSGIQGVETIQGPGEITVRVPGDILFAPGKSALRSSARKTLKSIAGVIKRDYSDKRVLVKGYTDTDKIKKSKWSDNLELSLHRAASVHRYLQEQGVDPHRMEAVGLGQWFPRGTKAKSRRVEIVVSLYD